MELENDVIELGFWPPSDDEQLFRARIHGIHEVSLIKRVAATESFVMSIRDAPADHPFRQEPGKMYRTSGEFAGYLVYQRDGSLRELMLESAVLTLRTIYSGHIEWIDEVHPR